MSPFDNKRIYLSSPHMSGRERELLLQAFDSNWIAPLGPHVDAFEREICELTGAKHACALSSGTAGLHLALILLGVSHGDEVFTSTLTFASTANAITYCGGVPVFIDSNRETWNMDPVLLEEELDTCARKGKLPKAVLPVDLYGQCADYDRISAICTKYNVPVIEDAAEALGATCSGKSAGRFGTMGVFSFNGNKIITTSGGGMLVSDEKALIDKARYLATQAREPAPHYEHITIGYNYRLSNLLAAVGRGQLEVLENHILRRIEINSMYRRAFNNFDGVDFMPIAPYGRSTCWLTCITINPDKTGVDRETVRKHLDLKNIEARPVWKPMHLQPVFKNNRCRISGVSDALFQNGLCLPSGSNLSNDDVNRVISEVIDCINNK